MKVFTAGLIAASLVIASSGMTFAQDAKKGKSVFNQCMACHALDKALVGPPLKGVVGRKAGSVPGYAYSALMKAASDTGLTWDEAKIVDYLKNPTAYLKTAAAGKGSGSSKMVFMLASEQQRKDVVAYLKDASK